MIYISSISSGLLVAAILLLQVSLPKHESTLILGSVLAIAAMVGFQLTTMSQQLLWSRAVFTALAVVAGYIGLLCIAPVLATA